MAMKKNSVLSRLFRSDMSENGNINENEGKIGMNEDQASSGEQIRPEICEMEFPPEHPVNQLWSLWTGESQQEPLTISLSGEAAEKELRRLEILLTSTGEERLKAIVNRKDPAEEDGQTAEEPAMDALPVAFISGDALSAWLYIYPPAGDGRDADREMILQALEDNKVSFGIDEAAIDELDADAGGYFRLVRVAEGKAPTDGADGRVEDLFPREAVMEVTFDEFDRVDYTSLCYMQSISEGDVICRIIAPGQGEPGRTVLGQSIPAKPGKKAEAPKGSNTRLSEDGTELIAEKTGSLEFKNHNFHVKSVLEINGDVDLSTGSINSLGDVHIRGDVRSGFTVKATGSVTVDGVVEASTIEAGNNLIVAKGVTGNRRAVIKADGSVYARYLENCSVYARKLLKTDSIINCYVYSDGDVQARSGQGTIAGGRIKASNEVSANVVGSRAETVTVVVLGGLPCEEFERDILTREIEMLKAELNKTEKQPESSARTDRMAKLDSRIAEAQAQLKDADADMKRTAENVRSADGARLKCNVAYPGTEVNIQGNYIRIENETRPCTVLMADNEIRVLSI